MSIKREQLLLYAVTDRGCIGGRDFYSEIENALRGGVTCLQLREKSMSDEELIAEVKRVKAVCDRYGVPLIVNDNYKAAIKGGADGVHVGIEDAPVAEIRHSAGERFIIGATAKTIEQAQKAQADGADYLGVGAVFASPTKANAIRITAEQLREICGSVQIPAVAIGGITAENVSEINGCGVSGIAVVSAIFAAEDVRSAAQSLKKKATEIAGGGSL